MIDPLPVSLASLVEELRKQIEVEPDECTITQLSAFFPNKSRRTLHSMLEVMEKKGQITSRMIGNQRYYHWPTEKIAGDHP
jgi:hypothetical protein